MYIGCIFTTIIPLDKSAQNMIQIEVAFATPVKQMIIPIEVEDNTSVLDAIAISGIRQYFTQSDLADIDLNTPIGVFGKKINIATYVLRDKDRIEIYRPLNKTPNQKRLDKLTT